ncbi:hypothetical protein ABE28_003720 [Peribacillus muralis]|uniref:Uncharacterized protein n=1 Tax=Peribacillus muralis TaxID=264697 RepID=A0A1B3XJQ4_9BACI|nr:hypothetical protein ABE28_003720 [Peribacillus muralis]
MGIRKARSTHSSYLNDGDTLSCEGSILEFLEESVPLSFILFFSFTLILFLSLSLLLLTFLISLFIYYMGKG